MTLPEKHATLKVEPLVAMLNFVQPLNLPFKIITHNKTSTWCNGKETSPSIFSFLPTRL
jgi:hypothetical protein